MRQCSGRGLAGLLLALAAVGAAPLADSPTATAAEPSAQWSLGPTAPALPYANGLVRLSPTRVLLVGNPYDVGGLPCTLSSPGSPELPRLEVLEDPCRPTAALLDTERAQWLPAARPPLGLDPYPYGSGYAAAAGGNGYFIAAHGSELGSALLQYSGTGNTWTVLAIPARVRRWVRAGHAELVGVGDRLVVLEVGGPGRGAMVRDPDGRWRGLPAAPFRARNENLLGEGPGAAVTVDNRLVLVGRQRGTDIAVASLDPAAPKRGWTELAPVHAPARTDRFTPFATAGRIVWPTVVYDPATGTSRPTPREVRVRANEDDGFGSYLDGPPDGLQLGGRATLRNTLFDPVRGSWSEFPGLAVSVPCEAFAWVGGPSEITQVAAQLRLPRGNVVLTQTLFLRDGAGPGGGVLDPPALLACDNPSL